MTREEAIDVIRYLDDQCIWQEDCIQLGGCNHCKEAINMAISALSSEPIRCKDCKYFKKIAEKSGRGLCQKDIVASAWKENDYCSRAERREP